jgi:hypothetical protein
MTVIALALKGQKLVPHIIHTPTEGINAKASTPRNQVN